MNLYFDTEFTGLHKDTTLISIGIVSEDGRKFYAEFTDYDDRQCDEWICENVLKNLFLETIPLEAQRGYATFSKNLINGKKYMVGNPGLFRSNGIIEYPWSREKEDTLFCKGDTAFISMLLEKWLSQFDTIQFVSDVCHYDFVLLIDLLTNGGTALDLPKNISAVCHDINQDIARHLEISDAEAFDVNREELLDQLTGDFARGEKHNALHDAEVIKRIYEEV